jgi:hypothetical protein
VITLRGNVGAFNLLDEQCRAMWCNARRYGLRLPDHRLSAPDLDAPG